MKKVLLTLSIIATLISCTTEEMSETQDLTFARVTTFTGAYLNYQVLIDGVDSGECQTNWTFGSALNIASVESCTNGSQFTAPYTTDDDTLYVSVICNTCAGVSQEYDYVVESNGDLTLTTLTGNYTLTYKLTR